MYAIVKTGGKQYRVEEGQSLLVDRLPVDEGASVDLEPLLWRAEETVFDAEGLSAVKVTAKVWSTSAGRSCACSSSSLSVATSAAPATARSSRGSRSPG